MTEYADAAPPSADPTAALTPRESVPLLTTWVSRLGEDSGIRLVVIKGPLAAVQGLRPDRESGDVDVWVEPHRRSEYVDHLTAHGWYAVVNDRPSILPVHAVTMRHERWACELDVHDRFPGFFADRDEVFERLWEHRTTESLAGAGVTTLSRAAHAVVMGLHLLRDLRPGRPREELSFLARAVGQFTPEERHAITELIAGCGANQTLQPFVELAGLPTVPGPVASAQDLRDWRLMTNTHGAPTVYWLHRLSRTPWWRWPALIWRSFWMSDDQIKRSEPVAGDSRRSLMRARLRRLRRGLAMLPKALRLVRSSRDGSSGDA